MTCKLCHEFTKALYQAELKYYNTRAGDDFHQVKVLMLAPTGKAPYNIKGNTIHSALAIPACQSLKDYKLLDSSRLNTLRCQLGGVKLIAELRRPEGPPSGAPYLSRESKGNP